MLKHSYLDPGRKSYLVYLIFIDYLFCSLLWTIIKKGTKPKAEKDDAILEVDLARDSFFFKEIWRERKIIYLE